jgi:hypothetical protein
LEASLGKTVGRPYLKEQTRHGGAHYLGGESGLRLDLDKTVRPYVKNN